jgi:hypothetical protein
MKKILLCASASPPAVKNVSQIGAQSVINRAGAGAST